MIFITWFDIEKSINIFHSINKLKKNNHMIISTDVKNHFQNSNHFHVKSSLQNRIEKFDKEHPQKATANLIFNSERLMFFP